MSDIDKLGCLWVDYHIKQNGKDFRVGGDQQTTDEILGRLYNIGDTFTVNEEGTLIHIGSKTE
jgi:hypothetical protein